MDDLFAYICSYAHQAPYIIFGMLMLAGLNIPLSEDILILTAGAIASTCLPSETYYVYGWILAGALLSAWEAYWIGRLLGPKLYEVRLLKKIITPHKIERLHYYYERYGIWTFIVGRFVPGGVRNALFMTSGLGKMPFPLFVVRDLCGCLLSSGLLFSIGYKFGEHHDLLFTYFKRYQFIALGILLLIILALLFERYILRRLLNGKEQ